MNPDFWRDKRVFVTGHTGFKGSWLCLLLHSLGARVAGYALPPPTEPSLYALARVGELVESTIGDIRDLEALASAMRAAEPEVVLHLAAQSVVLRSYDDPVETYSTNVIGTVHTLEAVRRLKRPCSGGQRDDRQVLREPGLGLGLPRDRPARRPRPVLEQQGLRRAGRPVVPRFVLSARARGGAWRRPSPAPVPAT